MTDETSKFWIVAKDANTLQASMRHASYIDAHCEAERLAHKLGERVYVLEAVGYARPSRPPIEWILFTEQPEEF